MKIAPHPPKETERLAALMRYDILDTLGEKAYNDLTQLASFICQAPIALISLIDQDRQWFKARVGLEVTETPRDIAFCTHAILQEDLFIIPDALQDERFSENPLVRSAPHIRFYAGAPLITPEGYPLGTLCVIDRSPRHLSIEQRKALRALADQVICLLELRLTLQRADTYARQLEETNASKNKLFSMISHDLKNPFNSILGFAELLLEDTPSPSPAESREVIEKIHRAAKGASHLLDDLLNWALCETGRAVYQPTRLVLDEIIQRSLPLLFGVAKQKQIHIDYIPNPALCVKADPTMLASILQNLLSNAIKFTPPQGRVAILTTAHPDQIEIAIADTGIGITEAQQKQLFRIGGIKSTQGTMGEEGTGLGLILCKQFLEQHGSQLHLASSPKGTTFRFSLPRLLA